MPTFSNLQWFFKIQLYYALSGYKCFQTSPSDANPWIRFTFIRPIRIKLVNLTFARDTPKPASLEIRVGNDTEHDKNPLCQWLPGSALNKQNGFLLLDCNAVGRIVSISSIATNAPMTLCDLKILVSEKEVLNKAFCQATGNNKIQEGELVTFGRICIYKNFKVSKDNFNKSSEFKMTHQAPAISRTYFHAWCPL